MKAGNFGLEFRPWPNPYVIESTMKPLPGDTVTYTKSTSFFIGIRVKTNKNVQLMQIDFSSHIQAYFESFIGHHFTVSKDSGVLLEWVTQRLVDIRIKYVSRDDLPDEVRPKIKDQVVDNEVLKMGKRGQRETEYDPAIMEQ